MNNYSDVDAILAEEEQITVQTAVRLYKMGWMKMTGCDDLENELDSDSEGEGGHAIDTDLDRGSMVSVPLWLAKPLLLSKKCSVSFPKYFDKPFLEKLSSHPDAVNLRRETTPHYYEQALQLANTLPDEAQSKLKEEALNVFTSRIGEIIQSSELTGHDAEETKIKLTNLEREIYNSSLKERLAKKWLSNRNLAGNRFAPYRSADLPIHLRSESQRVYVLASMPHSTLSCETNDEGFLDLLSKIKERSDSQKSANRKSFEVARAAMVTANEDAQQITTDMSLELRQSAGSVHKLMDSMQSEIEQLQATVRSLELENHSLRQKAETSTTTCSNCTSAPNNNLNLNSTIKSVTSIGSDDLEVENSMREGFATVIYNGHGSIESTHVIPVTECTTVKSLSQRAIQLIGNKLGHSIDINLMCLKVGSEEAERPTPFTNKNIQTDREREFTSISDRELRSYHFFKEWIDLHECDSHFAITVRLTELASLVRSTSITRKMSFCTPRRAPSSPPRASVDQNQTNASGNTTTSTPACRKRMSLTFGSSVNSSTSRFATSRTPTLSKFDSWRRRL